MRIARGDPASAPIPADLFKKVGKPSMTMSSMEASKVIETCWYKSGAENVTVIVRDGKVAEISGVEKTAK